MKRPIQGEKHHWFPKCVSRGWAGPDGKVNRTNSRGDTRRFHPKGVGYRPDGHNILFGKLSPWESTFEPAFDRADNAFPSLIRWLSAEIKPETKRLAGLMLRDRRAEVGECLASLVIRSPRMRAQTERYVAQRQTQWMGFEKPQRVEQTAVISISNLQRDFAREMSSRGKIAILVAPEPSFIFGDGMMHNLHDTWPLPLRAMAMVAFSPSIAVLWFCPDHQPLFPEAVMIRLDAQEVAWFNDLVQIYSRDNLFHVQDKIAIHPSFTANEHHVAMTDGAKNRTPATDLWMEEALSIQWPG